MNPTFGLGGVLVVVGLILVVIDMALGYTGHETHRVRSGLLHVGVLLIGIGVLLGHNVLVKST